MRIGHKTSHVWIISSVMPAPNCALLLLENAFPFPPRELRMLRRPALLRLLRAAVADFMKTFFVVLSAAMRTFGGCIALTLVLDAVPPLPAASCMLSRPSARNRVVGLLAALWPSAEMIEMSFEEMATEFSSPNRKAFLFCRSANLPEEEDELAAAAPFPDSTCISGSSVALEDAEVLAPVMTFLLFGPALCLFAFVVFVPPVFPDVPAALASPASNPASKESTSSSLSPPSASAASSTNITLSTSSSLDTEESPSSSPSDCFLRLFSATRSVMLLRLRLFEVVDFFIAGAFFIGAVFIAGGALALFVEVDGALFMAGAPFIFALLVEEDEAAVFIAGLLLVFASSATAFRWFLAPGILLVKDVARINDGDIIPGQQTKKLASY
mmetsp:Transcript_2176/g.5097  ORF Transcript_2176/g.5097 Transcript_2176/m.5097 type:complete len:384 (-) Transcript_2176:149-1300(-)